MIAGTLLISLVTLAVGQDLFLSVAPTVQTITDKKLTGLRVNAQTGGRSHVIRVDSDTGANTTVGLVDDVAMTMGLAAIEHTAGGGKVVHFVGLNRTTNKYFVYGVKVPEGRSATEPGLPHVYKPVGPLPFYVLSLVGASFYLDFEATTKTIYMVGWVTPPSMTLVSISPYKGTFKVRPHSLEGWTPFLGGVSFIDEKSGNFWLGLAKKVGGVSRPFLVSVDLKTGSEVGKPLLDEIEAGFFKYDSVTNTAFALGMNSSYVRLVATFDPSSRTYKIISALDNKFWLLEAGNVGVFDMTENTIYAHLGPKPSSGEPLAITSTHLLDGKEGLSIASRVGVVTPLPGANTAYPLNLVAIDVRNGKVERSMPGCTTVGLCPWWLGL